VHLKAKYTEYGRNSREERETDEHKVTVIGRDDGVGHSPDSSEAGFQVTSWTRNSHSWTGIGNIRKFVGKKVEKGKLTKAQCDDIFLRLRARRT